MTGWVNRRDSLLSGAELAIMKDLKWYTVNMTAKQPLFWGKNQGCNFGYLPCIDKATGVSISEPHFPQLTPGEVAPQTIVGSSAARLGCTIGRYFKALAFQYVGTSDVSPTYQQYFADTREFGNGQVLLEYCPYYSYYDALQYVAGETTDSLNCSSNHVPLGGNSRKELYGVDSRCLITKDGAHNMPSCYPVKCYRAMVNDTEQTVFAIKPLGSDDYTQCDFAGQIVTPAGTELEIFCPSSGEVCVNATMVTTFVQPPSRNAITSLPPESSAVAENLYAVMGAMASMVMLLLACGVILICYHKASSHGHHRHDFELVDIDDGEGRSRHHHHHHNNHHHQHQQQNGAHSAHKGHANGANPLHAANHA